MSRKALPRPKSAYRLGGLTVVGLPGQSLATLHVAVIADFRPGRVIVALDQEDNLNTDRARERWLKALDGFGLPTFLAVWEGEDLGGPKGIDDLFAAGCRPRLRAATVVPSEFGARRPVRETPSRGEVSQGLSLIEARRTTEESISDFVENGGALAMSRALLIRSSPRRNSRAAASPWSRTRTTSTWRSCAGRPSAARERGSRNEVPRFCHRVRSGSKRTFADGLAI